VGVTRHVIPEGGPERRSLLTRDIMERTGITEALIEQLVRSFYGRVQNDALLGPIFAARVTDWDAHIEKLCAFWSSVALMTGHYHGRPMQAHFNLPVDSSHFDRWLELFEQTANELCPPVAAAHFIERARRIADSFEMGIATVRGEIHSPRHSRPVI
jgi:hemoglobin